MVMEEVEPGIRFGRRGPPQARARRRHLLLLRGRRRRLAVSVIQSIYHDFGSQRRPARHRDHAAEPGLVLLPRRRPPEPPRAGKAHLPHADPGHAHPDDEPWLVYGTMGGEGQPQTHAALVTRIVDHGYDVQQAIEAPRWLMGRTWGVSPRTCGSKGRIDDQVTRELELRASR
jgi:gamma-glutamyltranspeptidase